MPRHVSVIAIIGIVGCLAMSMIMQYLLKAKKESDQPAVVREVQELFGGRLEGGIKLRMETRDGQQVMLLTLTPVTGLSRDRLARDVGQYVWRRLRDGQRPGSLEVVCMDPDGGDPEVIPVAEPFVNRGRSAPSGTPARPKR